MIPVEFGVIDESHIQDLVASRREEGRYIDFKRDWGDDPWDGLAKDVCAFANTDGGDIIIGVAEVDRVASKVLGVECGSVDRQIRNAEDGIRSRIESPVYGFRIRNIPRADGAGVFVIRVGISAAAPHRVTKSGIFYSRGSTGNIEMDIFQVREAFLRGTFAEQAIREFRNIRVKNVLVTGDYSTWPVTVLLHVISTPSMMRLKMVDASKLYDVADDANSLGQSHPANKQYNLDGVFKFQDSQHSVQFFRDGRIEGKMVVALEHYNRVSQPGTPIPLARIRNAVSKQLPEYVRALEALGFPPPYAAMLTLVNLTRSEFALGSENATFAQPSLEIPEVTIRDAQSSSGDEALEFMMDVLYQAFGLPKAIWRT